MVAGLSRLVGPRVGALLCGLVVCTLWAGPVVAQITELPEGATIQISWSGGNRNFSFHSNWPQPHMVNTGTSWSYATLRVNGSELGDGGSVSVPAEGGSLAIRVTTEANQSTPFLDNEGNDHREPRNYEWRWGSTCVEQAWLILANAGSWDGATVAHCAVTSVNIFSQNDGVGGRVSLNIQAFSGGGIVEHASSPQVNNCGGPDPPQPPLDTDGDGDPDATDPDDDGDGDPDVTDPDDDGDGDPDTTDPDDPGSDDGQDSDDDVPAINEVRDAIIDGLTDGSTPYLQLANEFLEAGLFGVTPAGSNQPFLGILQFMWEADNAYYTAWASWRDAWIAQRDFENAEWAALKGFEFVGNTVGVPALPTAPTITPGDFVVSHPTLSEGSLSLDVEPIEAQVDPSPVVPTIASPTETPSWNIVFPLADLAGTFGLSGVSNQSFTLSLGWLDGPIRTLLHSICIGLVLWWAFWLVWGEWKKES